LPFIGLIAFYSILFYFSSKSSIIFPFSPFPNENPKTPHLTCPQDSQKNPKIAHTQSQKYSLKIPQKAKN